MGIVWCTSSAASAELAYLNSGLEIVITDERTDKKPVLKFEGGIATYVADLNANKTPVSDVISFSGTVGGGGNGNGDHPECGRARQDQAG